MLEGQGRQDFLKEFFRGHQVADLKQLCRALKTPSRATIFRVLKAAGYRTSYSHSGKYYTLDRIPHFDPHGLWFWRDVCFSKHGTLRATIVAKVKEAAAGYTHDELEALLQLRVQNTLLELVRDGAITRDEIDAIFVYVDSHPALAKAQLARRRAQTPSPASRPVDLADVVEILLVVIRRQTTDAAKIAAMLRARDIVLSDEQVAGVLAEHGLRKKTKKSPSKRSPS